jgi:endogenous inhibitor of DNA gyrase (YacG/DUF329 family)
VTDETLVCPTCGEKVPLDQNPFWVWEQKFYCSERCVRKVATPGRYV